MNFDSELKFRSKMLILRAMRNNWRISLLSNKSYKIGLEIRFSTFFFLIITTIYFVFA